MQLTEEGFLVNSEDWSQALAQELAVAEGIELSDAHFDVLLLVRKFYEKFEHPPSMRPLVKYIGLELGQDKGNSIYLLKLFPNSPAKLACKLAGVPKPEKCL